MNTRSTRLILSACAFLLLAAPLAARDEVPNPEWQPSRTEPASKTRDGTVIAQSFESTIFPPKGWTRRHLSTSYTWARSLSAQHEGVASAWVRYGPPAIIQDEWLVSPALDFSTLTHPMLEFYEASPYWRDYGEHHHIMIRSANQTTPGTYTTLLDWTPLNHVINELAFGATPTVVNLSAYAGHTAVSIALRYVGSDADNWFVDDIRVFEPPLHDVLVTSVTPDRQQFAGTDTPMPQVRVSNHGRCVEDFTVTLTVTKNDLPHSRETVTVEGLAPYTDAIADFTALELTPGNYYRLEAVTELATDLVPSNNTGSALDDTYTGPHTPLGLMNTNAGCAPCVQANQALDTYLPTQGDDVACIRIHVWWPGVDGIYNANIPQSAFLANGLGADYAPHMWVDAVVDGGSNGAGFSSLFEARKAYHSPLTVAETWNNGTRELSVTVTVDEPLPPATDLRLRVAVTEDDVYYLGSNGQAYHDQAFRRLYPSTEGLPVPPAPGTYRFVVPCPLESSWNYAKLRATAYVQDNDSWAVHNTTTSFLSQRANTVSADNITVPARLTTEPVRPNPFNPSTSISFSLPAAQRVRVTVHDLEGKLVATLLDEQRAAGPHSAVWDGHDAAGRAAASGTYVFRIEADGVTATRRAMLVK